MMKSPCKKYFKKVICNQLSAWVHVLKKKKDFPSPKQWLETQSKETLILKCIIEYQKFADQVSFHTYFGHTSPALTVSTWGVKFAPTEYAILSPAIQIYEKIDKTKMELTLLVEHGQQLLKTGLLFKHKQKLQNSMPTKLLFNVHFQLD